MTHELSNEGNKLRSCRVAPHRRHWERNIKPPVCLSLIETFVSKMSYPLLVENISVDADERAIQDDLRRIYPDVQQVIRWYFDDECKQPMQCVQVNFSRSESQASVLERGSLLINGIYRPVSSLKGPKCHRCGQQGHKSFQCSTQPLNERDLLDLFDEQKK